jgi:uncharacterized membrane protein
MPENLVQHRGQPTIWDRPRLGLAASDLDAERWIAAASAGVLLLAGMRRRSIGGLVAAIAGAGLGWWAATSRDARRRQLARLQQSCGRGEEDRVNEAVEESFPASDPSALTPAPPRTGWFNGTRGVWPMRR